MADLARGGEIVNEEMILNERIEVIATFGSGQNPCMPRRFRRSSGREVDITEIGLCHPVKHGLHTIHIFDVTDGTADYRLEFDSERLVWRLVMEGDRVG